MILKQKLKVNRNLINYLILNSKTNFFQVAEEFTNLQSQFLKEHADLYENTHGAVRLHIQNGQIQIRSLACVGFASAVEPDFSAMYALGQCPSSVQK